MALAYKLSDDPRKFGKGMWISIHILAYHAKSKDEQIAYCKTVRTLCSNITCHDCRGHAMEFIAKSPPERAISDTNEKSMFRWSCDLHNNANTITKSPILNWELIYKEYEKNEPTQVQQVEDTPIEAKTAVQKSHQEIYDRIMSRINSANK